jgi:inorganic pyrophosphatase
MAHPWHDIALPSDLSVFPTVIEIAKGSKNKYEVDKETGLLRLDRVLYSAVHYPTNYGFVPRTYAEDDDPIDVLALSQDPIDPLTIVRTRVIGGFQMTDEHGPDIKLICVCVDDPAFMDYHNANELPKHVIEEMMHFFAQYKLLEKKYSEVDDEVSIEEAMEALRASVTRYEKKYLPSKSL